MSAAMANHERLRASPALISQIERELTVPLLDVLYQFADGACDELRRVDPDRDGDAAAQAVSAATIDTVEGDRPWDSSRVPLGHHLGAIVVEWVVFEAFRHQRRAQVRNGSQSAEKIHAWSQLEANIGYVIRFQESLRPLDQELVHDLESIVPAMDRPAVAKLRAHCTRSIHEILAVRTANR